MKSIKDFTDLELDEQIKNAILDIEEVKTDGDFYAAIAELEVARREKQRRGGEVNE